jgi:hypothetical protein
MFVIIWLPNGQCSCSALRCHCFLKDRRINCPGYAGAKKALNINAYFQNFLQETSL